MIDMDFCERRIRVRVTNRASGRKSAVTAQSKDPLLGLQELDEGQLSPT